MARYPKHYVGEAITKVGALVESGHTPIAAYRVVSADMKVPATTVARWYKNRSALADAKVKAHSTKRKATNGNVFRPAFDQVEAANNAPDPKPTLADYAAEFETLTREIPDLEADLAIKQERREELRKLMSETLGL